MELLSGLLAAVPLWLLWPTIAGIAVYWYSTRNHNYWKHAGVPYVPGVPVIGSVGRAFTTPMHEIELERYRNKGRIYGSYEGNRPILTIADPDVLRDIFVKDFQFFTSRRTFSGGSALGDKVVSNLQGEDWKRVRTIITPTFTTGKIKKMTSIFIDSAQTLKDNFQKATTEGIAVDVKRFFGAFSMDVITSSAFGRKIDSHNDPDNSFANTFRNMFSRSASISWAVMLFILFPSFIKLLRFIPFVPDPTQFFRKAELETIHERKKSGQRRNDYLQLLIDAERDSEKDGLPKEKDAASEMGHEENNDQIFKPIHGSKFLSNDEMVAQCAIFFIAGYDTTASILAFTAYELALNPNIQEQLIGEIDEAIREKGELRYETISEMKYLDCVVSETFRKYPPTIRVERIADDDYPIKKHNITVPKGMLVGVPVYAIHHDRQHYPDPEKYDPERFTPEMKATRHPYTYLPFGAGPRNCVAMRFVLMEVKVCLAYLLSQVRFHTCSETSVPPKYYIGQVALAPKEVMLKLETRNDAIKM